jgi:glycosyltransferase involved in cell wall biosynthesis
MLLAVGRLYPAKRWDRLIKVIALVRDRGLAFSVRHAGGGPLLEELQAQAKLLGVDALIQFLGPRAGISALLADSSFLVHTADEEGCPNVVMEAMACGRAVLATDSGDVPLLVEDGKTGFVVRRGDDKALADRLVELATNPDLCMAMGRNGRMKAEQEFDLHSLVTGTLDAYRTDGWRDE